MIGHQQHFHLNTQIAAWSVGKNSRLMQTAIDWWQPTNAKTTVNIFAVMLTVPFPHNPGMIATFNSDA